MKFEFQTASDLLGNRIDSDGSKEEKLNVVPYQKEMEKKGLRMKDTSWKDDLKKNTIKGFIFLLVVL
mgnify:CR=1 FL=1